MRAINRNRRRMRATALTLALFGALAGQASVLADEDIWKTYHDMGCRLVRYEKYGQAEEVLQLAIKTAEENKAAKNILTSLKELVTVYEAEKKPDKVEETQKRIAALEKDIASGQPPEAQAKELPPTSEQPSTSSPP
ncbi:MAG: hypothetical protein K2Z81_06605, partial [Cyanobacteria bacterium]|nr:hypothetical protein [Cyanobacteriota bacterium]